MGSGEQESKRVCMNAITTIEPAPSSVLEPADPVILSTEQAAELMADVTHVTVKFDLPDFVVTEFWKDGKRHMVIGGNQGSNLLLTL